jgi:hypothetical protein
MACISVNDTVKNDGTGFLVGDINII